jgi:hypothetical protein
MQQNNTSSFLFFFFLHFLPFLFFTFFLLFLFGREHQERAGLYLPLLWRKPDGTFPWTDTPLDSPHRSPVALSLTSTPTCSAVFNALVTFCVCRPPPDRRILLPHLTRPRFSLSICFCSPPSLSRALRRFFSSSRGDRGSRRRALSSCPSHRVASSPASIFCSTLSVPRSSRKQSSAWPCAWTRCRRPVLAPRPRIPLLWYIRFSAA